MGNSVLRRIASVASVAGLAVAISLAAPNEANAQVNFGAQASYGEGVEAFGLGARANIMIPGAEGFGIAGSFDYFFPDGFDWWEINGNAIYSFPMENSSVGPYVGAGLNYANASFDDQQVGDIVFEGGSDSEVGLNILGGLTFGGDGSITPFVEGRYETTGSGQFVATGGIIF